MDNPALLRKAREDLSQGHLDRAAEKYEKVLHRDGYNPEALVGMSRIALATDSFSEARKFAERALEKHPQNVDAATFRFVAMEAEGEGAAVLDKMVSLAKSNKQDFLPNFHAGRMLAGSGRFKEALGYLHKAAGLDKENYDVFNLRGRVFQELGELKKAAGDFQAAIKLTPQRMEAFLGLVDVMTLGQDYQTAETVLSQARTSVGEHPALWQKMAGLKLVQGDVEGAMAQAQHVCERRPQDRQAWLNLAWVRTMAKDIPGAEEAALKARDVDPGHWEPHFQLGMLYEAAELEEKAEAAYRESARLAPDNWQPANNLGLMLLSREEKEAHREAEQLLLRAVELSEGLPAPALNLLLAYAKLSRRDEGRELCRGMLKLDLPDEMRKQVEALRQEFE